MRIFFLLSYSVCSCVTSWVRWSCSSLQCCWENTDWDQTSTTFALSCWGYTETTASSCCWVRGRDRDESDSMAYRMFAVILQRNTLMNLLLQIDVCVFPLSLKHQQYCCIQNILCFRFHQILFLIYFMRIISLIVKWLFVFSSKDTYILVFFYFI